MGCFPKLADLLQQLSEDEKGAFLPYFQPASLLVAVGTARGSSKPAVL